MATNEGRRHHAGAIEIVAKLGVGLKVHDLGFNHKDVAAMLGVSNRTYLRWRQQFEGLSTSDVTRICSIRQEIEKLRRVANKLERAAR